MSLELGGPRSFHGPEYHVAVTFRAPLPFAYAWCTDFRESDPKLEGEPYQRHIVRRSPARVVYEDVQSYPEGWHWSRYDVRLEPPNKWSLLSIGNYRSVRAEYTLTRRGEERTQFDMWFKREAAARSSNLSGGAGAGNDPNVEKVRDRARARLSEVPPGPASPLGRRVRR